MKYKTTVILHGGLGNQLFQFFFALKQVNCNQKLLRIIMPYSEKYKLDLLGVIDKNEVDDIEILVLNQIFYKIISNLNKIFPRFLLKYFNIITDQNYNLNFGNIKRPFLIYGYFQDLELILEKEKILNFFNLYKNKEFTSLGNCERLGVHIRRGDYLNKVHKSHHGLIPIGLIVEKFILLFKKFDDIYVYSDSDIKDEFLEILNDFLGEKNFQKKNIHFSFNDCMSDKDVFKDMGKNKILICSNSTFSYWAGYLNSQVKLIYLPEKWFNKQKISKGLIHSRVKVY